MTAEYFIKSMACLLAFREERSNQMPGMVGVLMVLRNRVQAGWHGGSWLANITAKNQFSSISVRGDSQTIVYPADNDPLFVDLMMNHIDGIYDGSTPDSLTCGALYYADLTNPTFQKDGWFAKTILANSTRFPRVAQVASTTYFADIEAAKA